MKSLLHFLLALTVLGGTLQSSQAQTTKYVTPAGTGDGSNWTNASGDLQAMINAAASGDQVWVAAGTYYPTSGTDRSISFVMKNGVAIYGGFAGTESSLAERNWKSNTTTLSGDIGTAGINTDNSYHVIFNYGNNLDPSARLDGFTITAGNANGSDINEGSGGGLSNVVSAPAVANCHFINNSASVFGGGIFNTASESSPVITNCSFTNNSVAFGGGGMCNMNGASPTITNCVFNGNLAQDGGGIFSNNAGNARITNCSFTNNTGGAIKNISSGGQPSIPVLTNCILWNNTGGQIIEGTAGSVAIATYCIVQDGYIGTGNLDADPLFVNAANGDLHLQLASPAINAGLNTANTLSSDLDGNTRIVGGTIDIGAYESQAICPTGNILYVKADATGANNGSSWTDAYNSLQDALANTCPGVSQIWVAKGTYYPTTTTDRSISFVMKPGIAMYGGFDGTEQANYNLALRDFAANATLLSGDLQHNDAAGLTGAQLLTDNSRLDNSYHVIYNNNNGLGASAILDGFTVTNGNGNASGLDGVGGGMLNQAAAPGITNCAFVKNSGFYTGGLSVLNYSFSTGIAITHCRFQDNYGNGSASDAGGAAGIYAASAVVLFADCSFDNNSAKQGGGLYLQTGSVEITGCSFTNNTAPTGGGMYVKYATVTASNCRFVNNTAIDAGGGLYSSGGSGTSSFTNCIFAKNKAGGTGAAIFMSFDTEAINNITNCTIVNNVAQNGTGGIRTGDGSGGSLQLNISNTILWGNRGSTTDQFINLPISPVPTTISNSLVQGGYTGGTAIIDADPLLVDTAAGDLHPKPGSPVVNMGDNNIANIPATDLDGNTRIVGGSIDMGAYESQVICPTGNILYVKAGAAPGGNGSSWATAYNSLQDALANACVNVTQVWVAKGTYYPTTTTDRSISFVMKPGIAIYGGFAGTEQANYNLTQRNFATNPTILSGDIKQNDAPGLAGAALFADASRADNSYHVIYNSNNGLGASAILDGFTITNGNGNGSGFPYNTGGGMLNWASAPIITNCSFVKNSAQSGGGLYVLNGALAANMAITHCSFQDNYSNGPIGSNLGGGGAEIRAHTSFSILFSDCSFTNNSSAGFGGGLFLPIGSVEITGCSFTDNTAPKGGGMFVLGSTVTANNCRFLNNTAIDAGGGLYSLGGSGFCNYTNCIFAKNKSGGRGAAIYTDYNADVVNNFTNCTIVNNVAQNGAGGIVVTNEGTNIQLNINNTILWGNRGSIADQFLNDADYPVPTTISNSLVQGGYTGGTAIIDADPLLVDTAAGNLHLQACSPTIDAGTATGAPATDLDGNARPALDGYDMGAYEFTGSLPVALVLNCPPATTVYDCSLNGLASITKLAYATVPTSISQAALVAAGGSISGTCAVSNISYNDVIDAANSTPGNTLVNRTFTVTDIGSSTFTCTQLISLQEITIDASASSTPAALGSTATLSATVSPALAGVPVSFYLDNSLKGTSLTNASGVATLPVTGLAVDVYAVKALVGQACTESYAYLSIYDPNGGFVTGAGWINSPESALIASPLITGKANFGLNARYQKGKNIVDGDTEFKFKAGDFNFKSISNDAGTLVISGAKATYRGVGTVNNAGSYGFLVVAVDADVNSSGPDRFRIKIWDKSQGNKVVYDNQLGKADNADDATELGGGAIVIHTANVKKSTSSSALSVQELAPNTEEALAIKVSNNPSTEGRNFHLQVVSSDKTTPVSLRVIDASGRPVQSWQHVAAGSILEAGSHWTKGMYIVEAIQDKKRVQVKLVKL